MSYEREIIDVGVSQRILWVGTEAYPLHNIARAQTVKIVPMRGQVVWGYLEAIVLRLFLGVAAAAVTRLLGFDSNTLPGLVAVVVLVVIVIRTIKLIEELRTLYALFIETAGTPYRALVSADENLVTQLVHQIMDAINNPQAEFQYRVVNYHYGDKIDMNGDHNVGKVSK